MPKPGWGAAVLGDPVDLDDWTTSLKEPFDPWVEVHDSEAVLRSASLDELASASDVRDRATALIERLNGALALSLRTQPLRFGGVVQFATDGRRHRTLFAEMFAVERPDRFRAVGTVTGHGEALPPPQPRSSQVQDWAAVAEDDELLNDALIYFGRVGISARHPEATDWFDLYKALECLILRFGGGSEAAFLKLNWASEADIARLKRTANWARHARRKFVRPPNPMEFWEGRALLGGLLRRALSETGISKRAE